MRPVFPSVLFAAAGVKAAASSSPPSPQASSARLNAFHIFNSVHSAMREWGSSLHHNGMALIPAVVPRGTLLYHGRFFNATPAAPEWLAFELDHAVYFASSRRLWLEPPFPLFSSHSSSSSSSSPLFHRGDDDNFDHELRRQTQQQQQQQRPILSTDTPPDPHTRDETSRIHGYLHTFRAARDLSLLYLDGTSAARTPVGTLDTQDLILRLVTDDNKNNNHDDEQSKSDDAMIRAQEVCNVSHRMGLRRGDPDGMRIRNHLLPRFLFLFLFPFPFNFSGKQKQKQTRKRKKRPRNNKHNTHPQTRHLALPSKRDMESRRGADLPLGQGREPAVPRRRGDRSGQGEAGFQQDGFRVLVSRERDQSGFRLVVGGT